MADEGVRFIHKDGRIIPIRAAASAAGGRRAKVAGRVLKTAKAASVAGATAAATKAYQESRKKKKDTGIKVDKKFDAAGLGLSVASGVVAAATFGMGAKGFTAGMVGSHVLDAASIAANVKAVSGKGHIKERAQEGAKRETRNIIAGYGVYGAGILAFKGNRQAAVKHAKTAASYAQKVLALGRKALRVAR